MKPRTRDNLIYLAVGLGIAAFVAEQVFYSENHGRTLANLSTFVFRIAGSTLVVGYFVGREVRKVGATLARVVLCVVVAVVLQLALGIGFRQYIGQLSGISYVGLAALETFFIVNLATWAVSHFDGGGRG